MPDVGALDLTAWAVKFASDSSQPDEVDLFVQLTDDAITAQIPELADDPVLAQELHGSTRGHWVAFLSMLPEPQHRLVLPAQASDLARSIARRGLDLGVLLKVYRAAHQGVFAYFTRAIERLDEAAPPRDEVLKFLWHRADLWIDGSIEQLIEIFVEERQSLLEGALARRAGVIDALLDGSPVSVDDASTTLGHPLRQWQTAFVIWADQVTPDTTTTLHSVAGRLAKRLQGSRPLTHAAGSRDLWCWVATPTEPGQDAVKAAADVVGDHGLHATAGLPATGVVGFRNSHVEARAAQHLCLSAVRTSPLVSYADVELLCLMADRADLLQRLVRREVGALCGADKNLAQIRDTILTYLTNRMNVEVTAEQLFVHKNTVRYRLARAEELLGHPLSERTTALELGLRYVAIFGPPPDEP